MRRAPLTPICYGVNRWIRFIRRHGKNTIPVENKVKQGGMKQEGKRAGDEQANPQRAAQPSKLDENKETQPSRGVKREQD